jgi:hypothetical protein
MLLRRILGGIASALLFVSLLASPSMAQGKGPVGKWSFDETDGAVTHDSINGVEDRIHGVFKRVSGVAGQALRFDGDTTSITQPAASAPRLTHALSVEAWIAINSYPWNWVPIVDQSKGEKAGYFFGIDSLGHLGLKLAINGKWQVVSSSAQIPVKKWTHIAGTFDAEHGLSIYLDGKLVGELPERGTMTPGDDQDLLIGRVREAEVPAEWIHPKYPVWFSFDGIIDELQIYDRSLTPGEVMQQYGAFHPPTQDVLPYPILPSGPPGPGPFGAYYATLNYDDLWDAPRRVGPDSDVVVRFDQFPIRLVFWQGTNYIPAWVTENGKWYSDEFIETWGPGCPDGGDCEPMSDKQNRYAHVRILESTSARAVVHFRYGLCEVEHSACANPDPYTGWTDWGDEYYTVYPDGVAVRKQVAWTSVFTARNGEPEHEFQETIIINPPGSLPEDNIATDALTLANMAGETFTYSWAPESPAKLDRPTNANIQIVNLKSSWKPFQIVAPMNDLLKVYRHEEKTYSIFEWWNHWPVQQVQSSGISAVAPDKVSHSSLSHIEAQPYAQTEDSITKLMLDGLTTKPPSELVGLAKSWLSPPKMTLVADSFRGEGYGPAQRAFLIARVKSTGTDKLHATFEASDSSPLVNPAIVIRNWNDPIPRIKINGKDVSWGPEFRVGQVNTLEGTNLVIWMNLQTTNPTTVDFISGKQK